MGLPFCPHAECYDDHGDWMSCRYEDPRFPDDSKPKKSWQDWLPEDEDDDFKQ